MLSNKFKRICSHMIAVLSSVGMISISKSSDAADLTYNDAVTYKKGDTVTYKQTQNTNFYALYETVSDSDKCISSSSQNVTSKYSTYSYPLADGSTGLSGMCVWTCKAGSYSKADGATTSYSGITGLGEGSMELDSTSGCVYKPTSCAALANATAGTPYYDSNAQGFKCTWQCNGGYSVGGGTSEERVITSASIATSTTAMTSSQTCSARQYDIEYDCTTDGYISGSSTFAQTASSSALYGSSYTIEHSCISRVAGKEFKSWDATS